MMYAATTNDDSLNNTNLNASTDFEEPAPNLEVIYQAFGEHADLYKDVLQVKSTATAEQIQMAYFDRRSELFALLASIDSEEEQDDITASHRFHAERKMDAVVMAVRILGDPQLRQEYDNVMVLRQQSSRKQKPKEPPSGGGIGSGVSRSSSTREPDGVYAGVGVNPDDELPSSSSAAAQHVGAHDAPPSPQRRSPKRRSPKRRSKHNQSSSPEHDSSDPEIMTGNHRHHQYEPDYEFVSNTKGTKGKNKSKKHSKNKHQHYYEQPQHHHHQHHQISDRHEIDFEQRTIDEDLTYQDTATLPEDEATLDTKTWDEGTIVSSSTAGEWTRDSRPLARGGTSTLSNITNANGIVSKIQEEVAGTVEDTLVSFEQVLNVFTLQERDIQAVVGRIDKAKRQLRKRR